LRTLVRTGLFSEDARGRFELTALGATLRSDAPDSLRHAAIFVMSAPMWATCGALLDTLRSSAPSFVGLHDATVYEYLAKNPELGAVFNRYMTTQSNLHNAAIVDAYDFSEVRTLVDVGGGHGATLAAVLRRHPSVRGILFDLPEVVATSARLEMSDLADRCEVTEGDMLHSVPAGGDVYMIKRVMMDKTDSDAEINPTALRCRRVGAVHSINRVTVRRNHVRLARASRAAALPSLRAAAGLMARNAFSASPANPGLLASRVSATRPSKSLSILRNADYIQGVFSS
jgi:hypothetical protein